MLETRQKAFDWIVNKDPMQLEYDSPNLVQRFVLVLFYYQTTRHKPWKECNPPATGRGSASVNFCYEPDYLTGEATSTIWGDHWLSASHECKWAGITCAEKKQTNEINFRSNQLNGPLPWEIAYLPQLKELVLLSNMLTGVLPQKLFSNQSSLTLENLHLEGNRLTGTIPGEWFVNLQEGNGKLSNLRISSNRLTGKIPSEVGLFPLKRLSLSRNALIGSLPTGLFDQTSLEWLFLGENELTGSLPSEIGLLTGLQYLDLNHTSISGSLPPEIGQLHELRSLRLLNTRMKGTIPEAIYSELKNLIELRLSKCNFSGTISSSLGLLTNLELLKLANNQFHGTIPDEIEALTLLRELLVNGNDLSGTVPVSICQQFYAEEKASKVVADCLPNPETGVPSIQCPSDCCTSCCDKTGVCLAT
ncbi:leucine Rich Repeat [Seminavis robusta]|uniref:Leucine Rich Repeat n=1 Tax=Seminavis robusta TaxID=568900 RepID=A0A9N8H8I3_9STRA|nr:leucine Rich Repeat [Seminavis robusta]|eukprot:Sro92_g048170.1 leucine Rich Repeat (418) ;mRNA; r:75859-77297